MTTTTSGPGSSGAGATTPAATAPQVSVVIPALNAARTLGVQLEALARQRTERSFEVVVADNGSSDGTRELVESFAPRFTSLRWVDASARTGSNVARNTGTAAARAQAVLLCDADDEVDPDWLETMAAALESADAVGGRLDRVKLNGEYIQAWGTPHGHSGISSQLDFLPRPIGANAGFRKQVWQELGGFNEQYVRGGTETEFFWRLQLRGHTLQDVPGSLVHYRMRSSFRAGVRQMYIWGRQAPMLFKEFRAHGMPFDARSSLRRWKWLLRSIPRIRRDHELRFQVAREAAYRAGRIVGSVKYKVVYF
ncbi:glycosyltransferase [Kineococcus auxinigenes]|uniref:glycosyltransferase n=1 Tax=unclassified Kineococcus TaxID=2621656 RepID=UPI003D7E1D1E